jgi:hypothetical protein
VLVFNEIFESDDVDVINFLQQRLLVQNTLKVLGFKLLCVNDFDCKCPLVTASRALVHFSERAVAEKLSAFVASVELVAHYK